MVLGLDALASLLCIYLCEQRAYVVAQGLSALVEGGLHHPAEERLLAGQGRHTVSCQADDGTLHLWWRTEHVLVHREQVLDVIPCLQQHAQYAIGAASRCCSHAQCHLALYHARTARYQVAVLQHAEEYLAGDVVGIVACQHKRLPAENPVEGHAQEVILQDVLTQLGHVFLQVSHRLCIYLHHFHGPPFGQQILGEYPHARSHFQYGQARAGIHGVGYLLGHLLVGEEVLSQLFLRSYAFHSA